MGDRNHTRLGKVAVGLRREGALYRLEQIKDPDKRQQKEIEVLKKKLGHV